MLEIEVYSNPLLALNPHSPMWDIDNYSTLADYDLELLKPALLFGDRVNLVTFRETMRDMVFSHAKTLFVMPMRRLAHFIGIVRRRDPRELELLDIRLDELPTIEEAEEGWKSVGRREMDFWNKHEELVERASDNARAIWEERFFQLEGKDLERASASGHLSVEGWLPPMPKDARGGLAIDTQDMFDASLDEFLERLSEAQNQPMLDAGSSWVVENWTLSSVEKKSALAERALDWRITSVLAANSMMRLPGLERLSLLDVLDLREDLKEYLPGFRSEMLRLGDDIASADGVAPDTIALEVEKRWHRDIAPGLMEIRQQISAASYPRRLLNAATSEKDSLMAIGGAIMLGAGSVAAGLSALIPAAAAAAYPFAKAVGESLAAREEAKKNRLYFLYKLDEGIQQRMP